MKVLIACEESQTVCKAFRALGHEAYSNDIIDCSGGHPEWHIKGDALEVIKSDNWDLLIAHPPCTYLSNAGACRLYPSKGVLNIDRYNKGLLAKDFFMNILTCNVPMICVENPIPSTVYKLPAHTQQIEPYEFGHPFKKRTRLWLKNLPNLNPTNIVEPTTLYVHRRGQKASNGSKSDARERSKTFQGIADAMAEQWGTHQKQKSSPIQLTFDYPVYVYK